MTREQYDNLKAGDRFELDGNIGTVSGVDLGDGWKEIDWSHRPGERGLVLSDILMEPATLLPRIG